MNFVPRPWIWGFLSLTVLGGLMVGCEKMPSGVVFDNPLDPRAGASVPPTPAVTARWGNQEIQLTWTVSDPSQVVYYHIYRKAQSDTGYLLLDSTFATSYLNGNLENGADFSYEVGGMGNQGLEGHRSSAITVSPRAMDLLINEGQIHTDSLQVRLMLSAPPLATQAMRVSNDSVSLTRAQWMTYSSNPISWTLSAGGDSIKTAYGQFLNTRGQESMIVSDWIILK